MTSPLRLARFAFVVTLSAAAAASPLGSVGSVTAQTPRPGATISYAAIGGGAAGVDGRAYLPTTPAWVTVDQGPQSCANGRRTEISARSRTGQIREMHFVINTSGTGVLDLAQSSGCPSATITATLDDGRTLTSTTGTLEVTAFGDAANPTLTATFRWAPMIDGRSLPFRGTVVAPAPAAHPH